MKNIIRIFLGIVIIVLAGFTTYSYVQTIQPYESRTLHYEDENFQNEKKQFKQQIEIICINDPVIEADIGVYIRDDTSLCKRYSNFEKMCKENYYILSIFENNFSNCDIMQDEPTIMELKETCQIIQKKDKQLCKNVNVEPFNEKYCRAIIDNNINECKNLDNEIQIIECKLGIIQYNAIKKKDPSECQEINNLNLVDSLKRNFINYCELTSIKDVEKYEKNREKTCFLENTVTFLEPHNCELLPLEYKNKCIEQIEQFKACVKENEEIEEKILCANEIYPSVDEICGEAYVSDLEELNDIIENYDANSSYRDQLIVENPEFCLKNPDIIEEW